MSKYDVAILGAGPGGCALAIELARRGRRVVLLEARDPHGGEQFLTPVGAQAVEALGMDLSASIAVGELCIPFEDERFRVALGAPGYLVSRTGFGRALRTLATRAGADLEPRFHGARVEFGDVAVVTSEVGTTIRAAIVVDATGREALLGRQLGLLVDERELPAPSWAAVFHYPAPSRLHDVPCFDVRTRIGDRFLLLGDAAGCVPPTFGMGMQRAFEHAALAAAVLAVDPPELHAVRDYENTLAGMLRRDWALWRCLPEELVDVARRAQDDPVVHAQLARVLAGHLDDPDGSLARWGTLVS